MFFVEADSDAVFAGFFDDVRHVARAVLAVFEIDLGFRRAFHGDGEAAVPGFARPDVKVRGLAGDAAFQPGTPRADQVRSAVL